MFHVMYEGQTKLASAGAACKELHSERALAVGVHQSRHPRRQEELHARSKKKGKPN
jgi:hypothetical protein